MCAATLVFLTTTPSVCAQYSRRTAIVEAVRKTRDGIVTIKCERPDGSNGATGTGVIVDEHGYIVTSRHVVATAGKVRITLADGSKLTAQITAEETQTDLAILKVTPDKPLKALSLGPCSDLMVGETVIAVGNPYGYTNTVSTGIISALDRSIPLPAGDTLGGVIQINASINPGNSGGPLLNINGEWIGINAALRDGAQGIAFAINADTVKEMLNRHLSSRKLANVNHGLSCAEKVSEEGSARQHVVVASVLAETPAALAGIEAGDVILCVADRTVSNRFDIERSLWDHKPGEKVRVRVMRQQKEITVALKLGACSKHEATVERTASARR
jgi:serine protease Do